MHNRKFGILLHSTVNEMKAWPILYVDMGLITKPSIMSYQSCFNPFPSKGFPIDE